MHGTLGDVMIAEDLIERLATETRERLASDSRARQRSESRQHLEATGRAGRRRALSVIQECRVLLTEDGENTWEEVFDRPPTIAQLMTRVGADAFVVAVSMQRRTARDRDTIRLAAE